MLEIAPGLMVVVALFIDLFCGEPPVSVHPVVAIGKWLQYCGSWVRGGQTSVAAYLRGMLAWFLGASACIFLAFGLDLLLQHLPLWLAIILGGILLKPLLAWSMLRNEVRAVEQAFSEGLDAARIRLSYLVSRDTSDLDETEIRQSAIETLAENLNDSVVAPVFWFCLFGLPGAALYRFINTADAMWGYRGQWEWAGKWSAQIDDVFSWIPARLTAFLLLPLKWTQLQKIASETPSPNGGWPMGAMALRLDICLSKPDIYVLNADGRLPEAKDTMRALRAAGQSVFLICVASMPLAAGINFLMNE